MKNKWIIGGFVLNYVLLVIIMISLWGGGGQRPFGGIGSKLIEDYLPIVKYNEGIKTNLAIQASSTLEVTGNTQLYGTTTISASYDGFMANANFTMSTGTAKAVYTNARGDMMCKDKGAISFTNTAAFAPSLVVAGGTTTSATGYVTNLLASTTMGTTSNQVIATTYDSSWMLRSGESIVFALSDNYGSNSSSTYYGNWTGKMAFPCWMM